MRAILRSGWVLIALTALALVAACGSDDSVKDENPADLSVAQEETKPLDAVKAELIYREAVNAVKNREADTGEYFYKGEDIELVERSLELKPGYLKAIEVLAWVYSTYAEYSTDEAAHETALVYALELFRANSEIDVAAYQILGAAYYANGDSTLGSEFFDQAIEGAPNSGVAEHFKRQKQRLSEMFSAQPSSS